MAGRYTTEHLAAEPRGWKVRSKRVGAHVLRIAFPPGRRKRGSGKVLEVLHPRTNPECAAKKCAIAKKNPAELLIFGNPSKMPKNHKPDCECPFCKRARGEKNPPTAEQLQQMKSTRARSGKIRAARLNRNPKRRNPSDAHEAVKLFESFHGREASEVIEAQRSAAMRLDYTALGPLVALGFDDCGIAAKKLATKWDQCNHIDFEGDKVTLASSPNGKQLYFIGGSQNIDASLSMFEGVDTQKDLIDLGDVFFVVYEARKVHDNFQPADYCHRFGETGKTLPRLAYDKLKKEILLIGGEYFISTKDDVSPGIEG